MKAAAAMEGAVLDSAITVASTSYPCGVPYYHEVDHGHLILQLCHVLLMFSIYQVLRRAVPPAAQGPGHALPVPQRRLRHHAAQGQHRPDLARVYRVRNRRGPGFLERRLVPVLQRLRHQLGHDAPGRQESRGHAQHDHRRELLLRRVPGRPARQRFRRSTFAPHCTAAVYL